MNALFVLCDYSSFLHVEMGRVEQISPETANPIVQYWPMEHFLLVSLLDFPLECIACT